MDFKCDTTDNLTPSVKKENFVSNYSGVKLSILHSWCQIVCFTLLVPNCLFYTLGVKLSANMGGVKLSMVSNCLQPWRPPRLSVNVIHPYRTIFSACCMLLLYFCPGCSWQGSKKWRLLWRFSQHLSWLWLCLDDRHLHQVREQVQCISVTKLRPNLNFNIHNSLSFVAVSVFNFSSSNILSSHHLP